MQLKHIQEMQQSFDKSHQMKLDFYEKIDEKNLPALEHLVVCLLGELGEFSNLLKKLSEVIMNLRKSNLCWMKNLSTSSST